MMKEITIATMFRYAHVYLRALQLIVSGKIDVKPLITDRYAFAESVKAFEYATNMKPTSVKIQIEMLAEGHRHRNSPAKIVHSFLD